MDKPPASTTHYPWPLRAAVGTVMSMVAGTYLLTLIWEYLQNHPVVEQALIGGLIAALATALGTLPILFTRRISERTQDTLFGFGAGIMLAACAFSLILPGIEAAREGGFGDGHPWAAASVVGSAILLGAAILFAMDRLLPHEHFIKGREGISAQKLRRTWLFVIAITLHNLPEGLAIGVSQVAGEGLRANALTIGIAIQDVPEGLVVATALLAAGYTRLFSVLLGIVSGLAEPIGAVAGAIAMNTSLTLLPWGLGLAAGAMLFVISHEIIPESHRKGHEANATAGLMLGFVLMMMLDTALA